MLINKKVYTNEEIPEKMYVEAKEYFFEECVL